MTVKSRPAAIVRFKATILKFAKKGEKTGWTYIEIPPDLAERIYPGNRKSFRVKGMLDDEKINCVALLPMGQGSFIMPLNSALRKKIRKQAGAVIFVELQADKKEPQLNKDLMICLDDEPSALSFFRSLTKSHQHYFSRWIDSAKTSETKAKRIARTISALARRMDYGQMLREKA